jgi:mannose-1-phosphate guanylyltransferase
VGIRPTRPETRYGYIQISHEAEEGFSKVKTFTEKPEYEFARIFVESGEFYWNTGLFVWNVNAIISTMTQMLPEMSARLNTIFCQEPDRDKRRAALYECYESFPNISVDYAILEHSDEIYVFPADFGWSDLGTWGSLHVQMNKDLAGNVAIGPDITLYESRGCVVHTMQEKKVVIIGLEGCIVAENDDHLLICKLEDEQRIKEFSDKN